MRVWAVSDVHTDYKENMAWCGTSFNCMSRMLHIKMCITYPSYWLLKGDCSSVIIIRPVLVCRCEALSNNAYQYDVLILAGDVSDDQSVLRSTFEIVVQKFNHVFFVPGNHDLWVRRKERDLLDSLGELLPHPAGEAPSPSIHGVRLPML